MRKLLLQLDTSAHASVFDRVVAFDAGADEVLSYGGVTEDSVRELVHGAIFTRGPKDLHNTAIFIGGTDMAAGERLLVAVRRAFFGPLHVSVMLDSNGSNTTAVAAVAKLQQTVGSGDGIRNRRVLVTAGTGPVGMRASGLLARAGANVTFTTRRTPDRAMVEGLEKRFGGTVQAVTMSGSSDAAGVLEGAELVLSAGPPAVRLVPRAAWTRPGLRAIADVNAVPPLGVEGVEVSDDGIEKEGVVVFGALAVGKLKMKIHKACIARLFAQNDLILDAETIADVAREIARTNG